MHNKFKVSGLALCLSALLWGCNDGSGFVSTQSETLVAEQPAGESTIRNMVGDSNSEISALGVDSPAGEVIAKLIDGDVNSKFLTFTPEATIVFKATKAYVLQGYTLVSANDEPMRDPKSWVLSGSKDGENWVEIDNQSDQDFAERAQKNSYELNGDGEAYQYYQFEMRHHGTDTWGADILQLAELELLVTAEEPIVGFDSSLTKAQVGEFVIFWDRSLVSPTSWEWTFEDGEPATSSEKNPLVKFKSLGSKTVTLTATNDKGSTTLVKQGSVKIWDPNNPWAGFPQPTVSFSKTLPEHTGQKALEQVMPDLEAVIHDISEEIAKLLFNDITEINVFNSIEFITGEYDFPAAKAGSDEDMILMFDLNHLANIAAQGDEALRDEVIGVLWHELTHGYNNSPNSGSYQEGDEYHTYLESLANYIRIQAGYLEGHRQNIRWVDDWNEDAYNQTSFFLEWVTNTNRNTDFVRLFNKAAGELETWSFDAAFKSILGDAHGIEVVFAEYQEYLKSIGLTPPYPTPVAGYTNFAVAEGVVITSNATDIGIWEEGSDKLVDNNIKNKFNAVIEEPWWISQYAPSLSPVNEVTNVVVTIETAQSQVLNKYSLTTGNDNEQRDPTSWTVEGSTDGQAWTVLDSNSYPASPQRLTTFHFDVADNDTAYQFYRFTFENSQQGEDIGGDNGRLVQIGELALLTAE